ncbi:MAG TPA: hypothetical protein VN154_10495, partial [Rhizomicrobium sp.]|nr:hypothetical protein [Rhizomicrobium sp.]
MIPKLVSRRAALVGAASVVLAPTIATAGSWCSPAGRLGEMLCTAGLTLGQAETERQLKPHWCWAACIQTIFALHGYAVAQNAIVNKVFGKELDRSANGSEIMTAINGEWTGAHGRKFNANGLVLWNRVDSFERPDALQLAAGELDKGNPLIFATEGHSMVLTAMTYRRVSDGEVMIDSLTVRDPWPDAPNRRRLRE